MSVQPELDRVTHHKLGHQGVEVRLGTDKFSLNSQRVAVALDREEHDGRKASMVPLCALSVPQHIGKEHIP